MRSARQSGRFAAWQCYSGSLHVILVRLTDRSIDFKGVYYACMVSSGNSGRFIKNYLISASFADNMKAQRPVAAAGEASTRQRSLKKLIV